MVGTSPDSADAVAYWKLEDLTDETDNSNDLSNNGATSGATGKVDDCYSLDGNNDFMTANSVSTALGATPTAFSVSYWFKRVARTNYDVHWQIGDSSPSGGSSYAGLNIGMGSYNTDNLWYWGYYEVADTGFTIVDDTWYHIVFTLESSTTARIYVDGVEEWNGTVNNRLPASDTFGIGKDISSADHYTQGVFDEFSVFDTTLSTDEIDYLYNAGSPGAAQQYPFATDSVTLTAPNGGESFEVGESTNITWTSSGTVGNVKLEYSVDDGSNYTTIVFSTSNDGVYSWTVPTESSSLCLVKITDVSTPAITDVSDAVFSIVTPPAPPNQTTGGGSFVQAWLSLVKSIISGAFDTIIEFSNVVLRNRPFGGSHKQIAGDFVATVVKVHDGDTVTLRTNFRSFDFPLRVANVNALEMNAGGEYARDWLTERILGKEVLIMVNPDNRVGKYGRLIGEIFCGGFNVGEEMKRRNIVVAFGSKNHRYEPLSKILKRAAI